LKWFVVIKLRILFSKLIYETLLIVVVPLNVIKNDPLNSELLTILLPFIKMPQSWIMSIFLFFSLIYLQNDFSPFNNRVKQVFSELKVQLLLKSTFLNVDIS